MTTFRISVREAAPAVVRTILALADGAEREPRLRELVRIRASQINAWNRVGVGTAMQPEAPA